MEIFYLFLIAFISLTSGCKWIEDMKEQLIDFRLENNGFHRDYVANLKVTSMERFIDCDVAYRVTIPRGAFIDMNGLNSSMMTHCFNDHAKFDVETPEYGVVYPSTGQIHFYSKKSIRKLFIVEDELKFPVDLRYHAPSTVGDHEVHFRAPEVFITCCQNKTNIFVDSNCRRFVKKIPCGCGNTKAECEYIRLHAQPGTKTQPVVTVPVANPEETEMVVYGTCIVVGLLLLWIIKELITTGDKKKTE